MDPQELHSVSETAEIMEKIGGQWQGGITGFVLYSDNVFFMAGPEAIIRIEFDEHESNYEVLAGDESALGTGLLSLLPGYNSICLNEAKTKLFVANFHKYEISEVDVETGDIVDLQAFSYPDLMDSYAQRPVQIVVQNDTMYVLTRPFRLLYPMKIWKCMMHELGANECTEQSLSPSINTLEYVKLYLALDEGQLFIMAKQSSVNSILYKTSSTSSGITLNVETLCENIDTSSLDFFMFSVSTIIVPYPSEDNSYHVSVFNTLDFYKQCPTLSLYNIGNPSSNFKLLGVHGNYMYYASDYTNAYFDLKRAPLQNAGVCHHIKQCAPNSNFISESVVCTCNVGYTGPDDSECVACVQGKYKHQIGSSVCLECPAGKYNEETGAVSENICFSCPSDSDSLAGAASCTCNQGYTGPDGGPCEACTAGKYKDQTGSSACSDCLAGTYNTNIGATSSSFCIVCPDNSTSPAGSKTESDCLCKAGYTYKGIRGDDTCQFANDGKCDEERYDVDCRNIEWSVNYQCYAGTDATDCAKCSFCEVCIAGRYKSQVGNADCLECAAGTYLSETGATSSSNCIACPGNSTSPIASTTEYDCFCNTGYETISPWSNDRGDDSCENSNNGLCQECRYDLPCRTFHACDDSQLQCPPGTDATDCATCSFCVPES